MLDFEGRTSSQFTDRHAAHGFPAAMRPRGQHRRSRRQRHYHRRLRLWQGGLHQPAAHLRQRVPLRCLRSGEHVVVRRQVHVQRASWAPYSRCKAAGDQNSGQSYIGKVSSQVFGAQLGANVTKNILVPGRLTKFPGMRLVFLPKNMTCNNSNYQDMQLTARRLHTSCRATPRSASPTPTARRRFTTADGRVRTRITPTAIRYLQQHVARHGRPPCARFRR